MDKMHGWLLGILMNIDCLNIVTWFWGVVLIVLHDCFLMA
jgi:hypothetical protein